MALCTKEFRLCYVDGWKPSMSVTVPVAELKQLVENLETVTAERDRWLKRMKRLEARLQRIANVAEGKE